VRAAVAAALAATPPSGVLHIDTACATGCLRDACWLVMRAYCPASAQASIYKNEADVAAALAGVPRSRVFLVSKVSPYEQGYEAATAACEGMLARLGVDYLDCVLVHWPGVAKAGAASPANAAGRAATWRALEAQHAAGKARSLGVSNYTAAHLAELLASCAVRPMLNQVECHPALQQRLLRAACAQAGVAVVAYAPLGTGALLAHPTVVATARRVARTPAQVLLRWGLQHGLCVIPKASQQLCVRRYAPAGLIRVAFACAVDNACTCCREL
jgi:diketogulonate reductase-like aldo/keto reductase